MCADTHRIGRKRQEVAKALREDLGQRREHPRPRTVVDWSASSCRQLQEPGPAIGALEAAGGRTSEIGTLGRDLVRHELHRRTTRGSRQQRREIRKAAQQSRQHPVAMDAGMPVIAAVEDRMQLARRAGILRSGKRVIDIVRIFTPDMAERDVREARSQFGGEVDLRVIAAPWTFHRRDQQIRSGAAECRSATASLRNTAPCVVRRQRQAPTRPARHCGCRG